MGQECSSVVEFVLSVDEAIGSTPGTKKQKLKSKPEKTLCK